MTKITLGVSKVYKNSGKGRKHRKSTKRHWKHIFFDTETEKITSEWINYTQKIYFKTQIQHKLTFLCFECSQIDKFYVKNSKEVLECISCGGDSFSLQTFGEVILKKL